jgi:hypothetical protein
MSPHAVTAAVNCAEVLVVEYGSGGVSLQNAQVVPELGFAGIVSSSAF